ncbi:MAG TPA: carboxypeptidase-like regulatory domain-containing protein, partial [Pedobacter sp.]
MKKTVDNEQTDISQIQKYLNGELDAKAMHRLERAAQNDPFLMDALEGYAGAGDQQANLTDLSERLNQRVDQKVRRLVPWTTISIAAGVVGFMIVVGLFYKANQAPDNALVANNTKHQAAAKQQVVAAKPSPVDTVAVVENNYIASAPVAGLDKSPLASFKTSRNKPFVAADKVADNSLGYGYSVPGKQSQPSLAEVPVIKQPANDSESMPLDEMVVLGYTAQRKVDTGNMPQTVAINKKPLSQNLDVKVKGVTTTERPGNRSDNDVYALGSLAPKIPSGRLLLAGTVVSRDGEPLPGVTVKVAGKTTATQTDVNGKFALPGVNPKESITLSYIGFDTKKVDVKANDSLRIEMNANSNALNEVVVTQARPLNDEQEAPVKAYPKGGWGAFRKYIKAHAFLPANAQQGSVKVKFTVNPNGSVSNITLVKGLSPVADEQAVSIIRNGPQWVGSNSRKPEEV